MKFWSIVALCCIGTMFSAVLGTATFDTAFDRTIGALTLAILLCVIRLCEPLERAGRVIGTQD